MRIGEIANKTAINAKLIRHYESIGLLTKAKRTESGYRDYNSGDVQILKFIKRARNLGFSMKDIKKLLSLWNNKRRTSQDVKSLAKKHIEQLEIKAQELEGMIDSLKHLIHACHGDERPDCPIIDSFEGLNDKNS